MVSAYEVAMSGVHGKSKEVQPFCAAERKAVPKSVSKVVELFRETVKTKHDNVKLNDRNKHPVQELENVRSLERLTCVILEVM